jgi:hypothetical protein
LLSRFWTSVCTSPTEIYKPIILVEKTDLDGKFVSF